MASKTAQHEGAEKVDVEELLDYIDKTMERLKTLYEQYFLGMQKQPPSHIHNDIERRIRDLMQVQIRNTGLRYRFATLQQKFGSYHSYWRRTLRQIEQGTYIRQLQRIGRKAAQSGEEIPEEILAAMPKRMREQVKRDREQAIAIAARRRVDGTESDVNADDLIEEEDDAPAMIGEPEMVRNAVRKNQHQLSEADADLDIDAFFASVSDDTNPDAKPYVEKKPAFIEAKTQADPVPPRPQPARPPPRASSAGFSLPDDEDEATSFSAGPPAFAPPHRAMPVPPQRASQPAIPPPRASQPAIPPQRATGSVPVIPPQRPSQPPPAPGQQPRPSQPAMPPPRAATGPQPQVPRPPIQAPPQPAAAKFVTPNRAGTVPGVVPASRDTGPIPVVTSNTGPNPVVPRAPTAAPSQVTRPNPIQPGSSQMRAPSQVESMQGPFPRAPTQAPAQPPARHPQQGPRPEAPAAAMRPPPGMNDADVNALYAKYVKAKQAVGDDPGPGAYGKLLKTINAQAPKIMEQYKAKGVEFSVVVKDNQVIIKAKPKP